MSKPASSRLKQNAARIMQLWEERTRVEISASTHKTSLVLQNSLPQYLDQLVDELSTKIERTSVQVEADKAESTLIGQKHGRDRAGLADYSISQLISEGHLLRQVIFQVLEEEAPLEVQERDIIISSVEKVVNDAATEFSETLQNIQELFMETLTHDLRGPITIIKMGTQMILPRLEQGNSPIDVVAKLNGAIKRLDAMIQNLLDTSRLRAGQSLKLEFADCDLEDLIQDIVTDLTFTYGKRFVVVSDFTTRCYGDSKELRRVIENLAVNAVKYGASDTPITLTLRQTETQISLIVHNEGNPIAPEAQATLFQMLRRTTATGDQKGWGLGLFLAKSITEAHQGTIEVESAEGKGTSFIVKLPKVSLLQA